MIPYGINEQQRVVDASPVNEWQPPTGRTRRVAPNHRHREERMPGPRSQSSLSFQDAGFLYVEREDQPVNVAGISIFEGAIPLDECRRYVDSKLPLIPRYRQRAVFPPFNLGLPSWEAAPDFDIANHVRQVTLRRGTESEFKKLTGEILSTTLDRTRPLWDMTLVQGMRGKRTGLITRVHHCLADGMSGVALLSAVMDNSPDPKRPTRKPRVKTSPPLDHMTALMDGMVQSCFSAVDRVLNINSKLMEIARHLAAETTSAPAPNNNHAAAMTPPDLTRMALEAAAPNQRLPFNVVCHGPERFGWTEIPLPEIKAVKNACDVTVNDVILAVLISAIRRYAEGHDTQVDGRLLRIIVPVNLRDPNDTNGLGNRIAFLPVTIPLDIRDARELLQAVRARVAFARRAQLADFVGLLGLLLSSLPTPVQALGGPVFSQMPINACNTIITNVPGPQFPLYLLGHKMTACYPHVPIGGEMGMNCAVLSYDGVVYFGFSGNKRAVPDLEKMEEFVGTSFAEILASTVARAARRSRAHPKAKGATAAQ